MSEIELKQRPLLERARRLWALTQEGPEEFRIMHAILLCNLNVPELLAEMERLASENARLRAALASALDEAELADEWGEWSDTHDQARALLDSRP